MRTTFQYLLSVIRKGFGVLSSDSLKNALQNIALVLAGIWAVAIFWYQGQVVPAQAPLHLDITAELTTVSYKKPLYAVRGRINLVNTGKRKVVVPASWYNITAVSVGEALKEKAATERDSYLDLLKKDARLGAEHPRYYKDVRAEPVEGRSLLEENYWFDVGEHATKDFLTYVPDTFDASRMEIHIMTAYEPLDAPWNWIVDPDGGVRADRNAISISYSQGVHPMGFGWLRGFLSPHPPAEVYDYTIVTEAALGKSPAQ